jgi:hypothetical protein
MLLIADRTSSVIEFVGGGGGAVGIAHADAGCTIPVVSAIDSAPIKAACLTRDFRLRPGTLVVVEPTKRTLRLRGKGVHGNDATV